MKRYWQKLHRREGGFKYEYRQERARYGDLRYAVVYEVSDGWEIYLYPSFGGKISHVERTLDLAQVYVEAVVMLEQGP